MAKTASQTGIASKSKPDSHTAFGGVRTPRLRPREHLTEREVEKLIEASQGQPLGPTGLHHDPPGLQTRPQGLGGVWPAVE